MTKLQKYLTSKFWEINVLVTSLYANSVPKMVIVCKSIKDQILNENVIQFDVKHFCHTFLSYNFCHHFECHTIKRDFRAFYTTYWKMTPLDSWKHSLSISNTSFFQIKHFKIWHFLTDLDLTLYLGSPKSVQIARRPSPLYSSCKIAHMCHTSDISALRMVTLSDLSESWSWPWPELSIKY